MDVVARLPDCDGQAADAVSACTQVKMKKAPKLLKLPKSESPDIWTRLPRHKWPKSWSNNEDPVLYIFEDNEAVIKMIAKGRSPTMRHVSRRHRVALYWFFDRVNLDPTFQIRYIDSKHQIADILTKGNFTREEWKHLLRLFSIMNISQFASSHYSSTSTSQSVSKRLIQQERPEDHERVVAKPKPMWNLVSKIVDRSPTALGSSASNSPEKLGAQSSNSDRTGTRETRCKRFDRKHSIDFSSVASRRKYEHQYGETCGGNEKDNHWHKIIQS